MRAAAGGGCVLQASRTGEGDRLVVPFSASDLLTPLGLADALDAAAALDGTGKEGQCGARLGAGGGDAAGEPASPSEPAQVTLAFSDGHMVSFLPIHSGLHAPEGQPVPVPRVAMVGAGGRKGPSTGDGVA